MNDAQMLCDLFVYALNEPDQPAENPVTVWFEQFRTSPGVGRIHGGDGRINPDAEYQDDRHEVNVFTREGEAAHIQLFRDSIPVGAWDLHRHAVDDARGIARRKGVLGPKPSDGMTLREAAEQLGIQPDVLRVQIHNGKLHGVKRGRDWFVTQQEVDRYREHSLGRVGQARDEEVG